VSHTITVYTREDCHLCAEALATVREVVASVDAAATVETVDVDEDPALRAEYGDRVPYVFVDGDPAAKIRVDPAALRARLDGA
jgi:glutaredoxin